MYTWKQSITAGLVVLFLFFIFGISSILKESKSYSESKAAPHGASQSTPKPTIEPKRYEVIKKQDNNLYVLLDIPTPTKKEASKIAENINKDECSNECSMISLFDSRKAANLDIQYSLLDSSEEMTEWKKSNYIYVGDHLIGYLFQDGFSYFPMKDWYYEELKSAQ